MSNPDFDPHETDELIIGPRLNAFERAEANFAISGLGLTDAGGLLVELEDGFLYANGYEVEHPAPDFLALTDNATNYVFFGFTRTPDPAPPATSVLSIAPDSQVNTSGISPGSDYVLVGTVDTSGGVITLITATDLRRIIGPAQLGENIEGNHNQIRRLVIQKGPSLPAPADAEAGELFFLTADLELYKFDGVAWVKLAAAATPPAPGAIAVVNGTPFPIPPGTPLRASPGMPGSVEPASKASEATAQVVGIADVLIPPFGPGTAGSVQGILITAEFAPGLALTSGETAFLGVEVLTNVQTAVVGEVVKQVGILWDDSAYTGIPPFTTATILLQIEEGTTVS